VPKEKDNDSSVIERLDTIIRLLEDLFILEATRAKIGRENIREVLGVRTTRISRIYKSLKEAT